MANITSVLTMLLRLRQGAYRIHSLSREVTDPIACDHPSLVISNLTTDLDAIASTEVSPVGRDEADVEADDLAFSPRRSQSGGTSTCSICHFPVGHSVVDAACGSLTRHSLKPDEQAHCGDCAKLAWTAQSRSTASAQDLPPISAKIRVILRLLSDIDERGSQGKRLFYSRNSPHFSTSSSLSCANEESSLCGVSEWAWDPILAYDQTTGPMRNDKRQEALERSEAPRTFA